MNVSDLIDKIEDLLNKIKELDRQQRRKIRELENQLEPFIIHLPPLVPGSGDIK